MEARLGHDFSRVRIHDDPGAAVSARAVDAAAYTVGPHVVFDEGAYAPRTAAGRKLLAHELTHVVQHDLAGVAGAAPTIAPSDSPAEREARGTGGRPRVAAGAILQRQPRGGDMRLRPPPLLARSMGSLTIDSFATDSAGLPGTGERRLAELAARIVELRDHYPGGSVRVVGHTDAVGAEAHNEGLGQRRADAVRDALVAGGVPADIVSSETAGEAQPAVPSTGPSPRNRRVAVIFEPEPRFGTGLDLRLRPPEPPAVSERPPVQLFPPRIPTTELLRPETPEETGRRIFRPLPPAPAGQSRSATDVVNQAIDRAINPLIRGLPPAAQSAIRDATRAAVWRGADALLDNALREAGLPSSERDAIKKAVEAARRTAPPR
jgi:outer membrane protein OmpA-like peptidoglycan-associated protein